MQLDTVAVSHSVSQGGRGVSHCHGQQTLSLGRREPQAALSLDADWEPGDVTSSGFSVPPLADRWSEGEPRKEDQKHDGSNESAKRREET